MLLVMVSTASVQGLWSTRKTPPPEFPRRVIIAIDPGIDDAMAVLALRSPALRVEAITVVAGRADVIVGE